MVGNLRFTLGGLEREVVTSPLETLRIVSSRFGFDNIDAEPTEVGWRIKASGPGMSATGSGKSQTDAVVRLLEVFYGYDKHG